MKVSSQKMGLAVSTTVAPTARFEFFRHSSRTYIAFLVAFSGWRQDLLPLGSPSSPVFFLWSCKTYTLQISKGATELASLV
jgi:hypothetical protein